MRTLIKLLLTSFSLNILSVTIAFTTCETCPEFSQFPPKNGPFALVNCDFHKEYEKRIDKRIQTFGASGGQPIILNLGGTLLFKHNGKTEIVNITPENYQYLKSLMHATFSIYLILSQQNVGPLTKTTRDRLQLIKQHFNQAISTLPSTHLSEKQQLICQNLSHKTNDFIENLLRKNDYSKKLLDGYYENIRPLISQANKEAAMIELNVLNKAIDHWLTKLNSKERKLLGVVVATAHQARANEVSLQYFSKKFNYQMGEGALHENGLVVLEGKFDEKSALMLLARHYLDQEAATVIFNNPSRLQQDALAVETKEILR